MKHVKKILGVLLAVCILLGGIQTLEVKASTTKLSKSSLTLVVQDSYSLRMIGSKKAVKWTSSSPKVATVTSKGVVKAKTSGSAVITAKTAGKKYTCKVTVLPYMDKISKEIAQSFAVVIHMFETSRCNMDSLNIMYMYKITPMEFTMLDFSGTTADYVMKYSIEDMYGKTSTEYQCYNSKTQRGMGGTANWEQEEQNYQIKKTFSKQEFSKIVNLAYEIAQGKYILGDQGQIGLAKHNWVRKGTTTKLKLNNTEKKAVWSSTNTKVVTVDKTGKIKAVNEGVAVIKAKLDGKTYKCRVYVTKNWSDLEWELLQRQALESCGYKYCEDLEVVDIAFGKFKVEQQKNDMNTIPMEWEGQIMVHIRGKNNKGVEKEYYKVFGQNGNKTGMECYSLPEYFKTVEVTRKFSKTDLEKANNYMQDIFKNLL